MKKLHSILKNTSQKNLKTNVDKYKANIPGKNKVENLKWKNKKSIKTSTNSINRKSFFIITTLSYIFYNKSTNFRSISTYPKHKMPKIYKYNLKKLNFFGD